MGARGSVTPPTVSWYKPTSILRIREADGAEEAEGAKGAKGAEAAKGIGGMSHLILKKGVEMAEMLSFGVSDSRVVI